MRQSSLWLGFELPRYKACSQTNEISDYSQELPEAFLDPMQTSKQKTRDAEYPGDSSLQPRPLRTLSEMPLSNDCDTGTQISSQNCKIVSF